MYILNIDDYSSNIQSIFCGLPDTYEQIIVAFKDDTEEDREKMTEVVDKLKEYTQHAQYFVGGPEWGCKESNETEGSGSILRSVTWISVSGNTLHMTTDRAYYNEMIVNGDISYEREPIFGKSKDYCFGFNTDDCLNAKSVIDLYTLDPENNIKCTNCMIGFSATAVFDLEIKLTGIKFFEAGLKNMKLQADLELTAQALQKFTYSKTKSFNIPIKIPPIVFKIGIIPVVITFKFPVDIDFSLDFYWKANLKVGAIGVLNIGNAYLYNYWNGFNYVAPTSPTFTFTPILSFEATVITTSSIAIKPSVEMAVDWITAIAVTPYPTIVGTVSTVERCLTLNEYFKVDLYSRVGLLGWKNFKIGPKNIYTSDTYTIIKKCI